MASSTPRGPNIFITGTPGTGRTTLGSELAQRTGLKYIDVSQLAREHPLFEGDEEDLYYPILDDDKIEYELEEEIFKGGNIVDYHACDFFGDEWFDIVFVLRTDNSVLYDRLQQRGYTGKKLEFNIELEISNEALEEARHCFPPEIVYELQSNTSEQLKDNLEKVLAWIATWQPAPVT